MPEIFQQFLDKITEILRLIKSRIQIRLAVVAMVALLSMTAFLHASETAIEVTSPDAEISVNNPQQSSGETNTNSGFSNNSDYQSLLNLATNLEIDVQTRFNEIRSELLDEQASSFNLTLTVFGLFIGLFSMVIAIISLVGFKKFREIETEAKTSAKIITDAKEAAERDLSDIRKKSDAATDLLKEMHAESAAENPTKATLTVKNVQEDPHASLIDKAIADAVSLQQQNKQEDAIEKWRAIAKFTEGSDNALAARAWFSIGYLSSAEDVSNKISSYDRVIQLKPNFLQAYVNRGIANARIDRHEDAIADFDKAIKLNPDRAESYTVRAIAKAQLSRHEDAIVDYDKAIELNPEDAKTHESRAISNMQLGRHEDAIADYDKAIKLNPQNSDAHRSRAISKMKLGRHEDAITDFDEAIRLNPGYADAWANRGLAKISLGRHEDAIADYDKAIELNPAHADAHQTRALAKVNLGRNEDAIVDYDKAIELNADRADPYTVRAIAKTELGRHEEAIADFDKAVELNPQDADLHQGRGISKMKLADMKMPSLTSMRRFA